MQRLPALLAALAMLGAACTPASPTPTPVVETAAPSASLLPTGTASPRPPAASPTPLPVEGTLSTQVNARSGPDTSYPSLGLLPAGFRVQIVGRNPAGSWYQVLYPPAPGGLAWVTAAYVTLPAGTQVPLEASPTPDGPTGRVVLRLNVRSGPAASFPTLGLLEPGTIVALLGKNGTASWFQIAYPAGPNGTGWVTAQYLQTDSAASLPVVDEFGNTPTPAASHGTPAGPAAPPAATVGPAYADGDSASAPAVRELFSPAGRRQFIYSSAVSAPDGDPADWVEFSPYGTSGSDALVLISLECAGNAGLSSALTSTGLSLSGAQAPVCGDRERVFQLPAGQASLLELRPLPGAGPQLIVYRLTVRNGP